jgi:hypothetical protein
VETGITAIAIAPLVPVFLPPFSFQQPALLSANPQPDRCQATQNPALSFRRQSGGSKKPRATFHNKKSQKQRLNPLSLLSHHTTIPLTLQPPAIQISEKEIPLVLPESTYSYQAPQNQTCCFLELSFQLH